MGESPTPSILLPLFPPELVPYLSRWLIVANPGGLAIWSAELRSPDSNVVRFIVAHTAGELAGQLAVAEQARP